VPTSDALVTGEREHHVATAIRCGEKKATTTMKKKSGVEEGGDGGIARTLTPAPLPGRERGLFFGDRCPGVASAAAD